MHLSANYFWKIICCFLPAIFVDVASIYSRCVSPLCVLSAVVWGMFSICGHAFIGAFLGSSGVSLSCLDDLTRQFQILWQCPMLQFEAGCWSTLSMQELLSTWKEFISKLRSKHRSLLRRGLTFVLNGHLNCCFKTQEAKGEQPFFFAPADSYHVPDSCDTGPGEQEWTPPYPSPH